MTAPSVAQVLASCEAEHLHPTEDWSDMCQKFTRTRVGAPAWATSARGAFNAIPAQHRHTSYPPPAGAPTYFGLVDRGQGHADMSAGAGKCWTTDAIRAGKVDLVPWDWPVHNWDLPYRGWTDWVPVVGTLNIGTPPSYIAALTGLKPHFTGKPGELVLTWDHGTGATAWEVEVSTVKRKTPAITRIPAATVQIPKRLYNIPTVITVTPRSGKGATVLHGESASVTVIFK